MGDPVLLYISGRRAWTTPFPAGCNCRELPQTQ